MNFNKLGISAELVGFSGLRTLITVGYSQEVAICLEVFKNFPENPELLDLWTDNIFTRFTKKKKTQKLVPHQVFAVGELMAGEGAAPSPTLVEMLLLVWLGPRASSVGRFSVKTLCL